VHATTMAGVGRCRSKRFIEDLLPSRDADGAMSL